VVSCAAWPGSGLGRSGAQAGRCRRRGSAHGTYLRRGSCAARGERAFTTSPACLARRLQIVEHIDRHVPKRGGGPIVGRHLLVVDLNRCVAPCSKAQIGAWFEGTVLPRWLGLEPRELTCQRFWDHMDRVSPEAIVAIERDLSAHLVREFDLDLRRVLFDATNFFIFLDTFNARSRLAQRGHSKEGRASLRLVGLALLVAADFHVPLLHRTYPGNPPDAPTFASLTDELVARYREVAQGAEHVTLIFDKGNNSQDNLDAVAPSRGAPKTVSRVR